MRLSDAMMLGSVTCRMEKYNWNSCALGCAGNAVGIPNWGNRGHGRHNLILQAWPWLLEECPCEMCVAMNRHRRENSAWMTNERYMDHITSEFDIKICYGDMTLEQLIDWVRSVEPKPLGLPAPAPAMSESVEAVKEMMTAL